MKQYISKSALVAEIEKELNTTKKYSTEYVNGKKYALIKILSFLDTLEVKEVEEEPVSNDLEEAASQYPSIIRTISPQWESELENAFKAGAQWQKEQMITKACVFLKSTDFYKYYNREFIKEFKKAMRE